MNHNTSFKIRVPETTKWDHGSFLAVSVTSEQQEFEQVSWILKARAVRNRNCRKLEITVRPKPNQNANLAPKADEISILDEHYIAEGRSLYLLLSSKFQALLDDLDPDEMIDSFERTIGEHFQDLHVIPPPKDITTPPDVFLDWIDDLEVGPRERKRVWQFGKYLEALSMITGSFESNIFASEPGCLHFDYQLVPFLEEFGFVREVISYPLPRGNASLKEKDYEAISDRWGFYTLLALCVHEVNVSKSSSVIDRSRLERVRAYLVAERSSLAPKESLMLRKNHIEKLLGLVDEMLGTRRRR